MTRAVIVFIAAWSCAVPALAQEVPRGLRDVVNADEAAPRPPDARNGTVSDAPATVEEAVAAIPLTRKVSQLMFVTLEGQTGPNATDRQLLDDFPPGGVVVPRVTRPEVAAGYVTALRGSAAEAMHGIPLFIATDLLTVTRFPERPGGFYFQIPSMLTLAAAGDSEASLDLFRLLAHDLGVMGFNFHLGPALDLASPMPGEGGGVFNFGADPETAAALARQFGQAMKENNLGWIPMGFPGGGGNHGRGEPAVLLTPRSQLRKHDLLPYDAAMSSGARLLQVGTTLVPTIDEAKPAALSPLVIGDLTRNVLGFDGLVIAGPMDSRDITAHNDASRAAVEALISGADMLYWQSSGERVMKAVANIAYAVQKGALDEAIIDRAYLRVLAMKDALHLAQRPGPDIKDAQKLAKKRPKSDEPLQVERQAITLVKNAGQVLPLTEENSQPIGVTGSFGVEELHDALEEYIEPIFQQSIRTARHLTRIQQFEIDRLTKRSFGGRTVVCIFSDEIEAAGQLRLLRTFRQQGLRTVAVLIGYPKNLMQFIEADAIILAYSSSYQLDDTMKAVAEVLVGNAPVEILPPVRNLEVDAGQEVRFDVYDVLRSPVGRMPITIAPPFEAGFSVSYRPELSVDRVRWEFGDGRGSRDAVATHVYKKPGRYEVTLTVEGDTYPEATGSFGVVVR